MSKLISVVSTPSLEKWDWRNPEKGIGGSETSHVRMAQELYKRGHNVLSFSPLEERYIPDDPTGLTWMNSADAETLGHSIANSSVVINYRDPKVCDSEKPAGAKWWFIAQDVDYGDQWTPERLAKVDRYVTLCPTHAAYTKGRYPDLHTSGKLFISSNGISSEEIAREIREIPRNKKRLMYASSPDRGLMLLLENWFRIRERVPDAEIHVFYGFQNYLKIIEFNGVDDWRTSHMAKLYELLKQPGVVWHDRVGQRELWQEWAKSNIWFYPTDFPETSCITSMEAQACGAIPVTTNFWALKSNIIDGYTFDSTPQKSEVVRSLMIEKVVELLKDSSDWDDRGPDYNEDGFGYDVKSLREAMQRDALNRFDWRVYADQWDTWIREDLGLEPFRPPKIVESASDWDASQAMKYSNGSSVIKVN